MPDRFIWRSAPIRGTAIWIWSRAPGQREDMLAWLDATEPGSAPPVTRRRGRKLALAWSDGPLQVDDDFPEPAECHCTIELELDLWRVLVPATAEGSGGGHG